MRPAQSPVAQSEDHEQARARRETALRREATRAQMSDVHPGDIIAGRYRVAAIMGRGRGMLLDASHTSFEQRVAIRVISPALADPKAVDRFQREARILSKLESEHVARIIDVGTLPSGALYLAREHLDGEPLAALALGHGLPLGQALDLFLQICEAVGDAHNHGVVLRDLQLSHVFLTKKRNGEPVAKLTDFGTCKVMRDDRSGELSCTKLLGLSSSASPELVRQQKHIDERADVWSLGCMLYELITGGPAFLGDGTALMLAIAQDEPVPPSSLRSDLDVPHDIDRIVLRALSKQPDARFGSVYEMVRGLRPHASARGQLLIEQIARLAGEEPTALSRVSIPAAPPSFDDESTLAMVRSVIPSEPARAPSTAPISAPPFFPAPPPVPAFPSAPSIRTTTPGPMTIAAAGMPLRPRQDGSHDLYGSHFPWENDLGPSPRMRRIKVAAVMTMLPVAAMLMIVVLSAGQPVASAAVAQAGIAIPSIDAIEAQIPPIAEAPKAAPAPARDEPAKNDERASDEPAAKPSKTTRAARSGASSKQFLSSLSSSASKKTEREPREAGKPDAKGQIVAMAVGASCAFSIDGAARGTSSSVKVSASVGNHTVSCHPAQGGAARTRSVMVEPGKAAVAVFRF